MELEKLLLKKEEIPIIFRENDDLSCPLFFVPIHPKLLNPNTKIDSTLAHKVFPDAAKEWYKDLQEFAKKTTNDETKEYIDRLFLSKPLSVKKDYGAFKVNPPGYWDDHVVTLENGFANGLSIDRNAGGSLFIDSEHPNYIMPSDIKFSAEKFCEFSCEQRKDHSNGATMHIYHLHNVDYYPGALFLRNWAILYLNAALKQIF